MYPLLFMKESVITTRFYLGITRTEAFLMASSTSYLDVRSVAFSRFSVLLLLTIYEYHIISVQSRFNLMLILIA